VVPGRNFGTFLPPEGQKLKFVVRCSGIQSPKSRSMKQLFADYHLKKSSIIFLLSFAFASGARICPEVCKCISNSYDDPEAELTYVDCAYKNLSAFPETLPHSTVELMMQGNHIDTLNRPILGTAFSDEGSPYTMTLQKLHLLRVSDTRIN
jgi:hypothetical protein